MVQGLLDILPTLYESDETAWLEEMSRRIDEGRYSDLDYLHLKEYLADMARRDRREVESRMTILFAHILKWELQPQRRSASWRGTIIEQRQELEALVNRGVLRNHAEAMLAAAYQNGVMRARAETDLPAEAFPNECPYTLQQLLAFDVFGSDHME